MALPDLGTRIESYENLGFSASLTNFHAETSKQAYARLQRLETHLRRFIDEKMTSAFGEDWPRHRLQNNLDEQWVEKKQKAAQEGRKPLPLVYYAAFPDYERVILKRDNYRQVFSKYFCRTGDIRESLRRLYPIRLDIMHSRPITQEDQILLYVEVQRVFNVILPSENGS